MKVSWTNVGAVVVALAIGRYAGLPEAPEPVVITRVDTVAPAEMLALIEAGALENTRLNRLLKGIASRPANAIIRTDTFVTPPDTVLQLVAVKGPTLTLAPLIGGALRAPELHTFDVGDCDDGWSWSAGEVVCDRARFGHLSLYASLGATGSPFDPMLNPALNTSAGIEWTPSYRSPWRSSIAMAPTGRLDVAVVRRWSIW